MSVALPTKFSDGSEGLTFSSEFAEVFRTEDDKMRVRGLALPFAETYHSPYGDIAFDEGAFDDALDAIAAKSEHAFLAADGHSLDANYLLASTKLTGGEGSLSFQIDDEGLVFEAELADTTAGRDIFHLVELGILNGVSVGVSIDEYSESFDEATERDVFTYEQVGLREISLVSYPAFQQTWIDVKEQTDFDVKLVETLGDEPDVLQETIDGLNGQIGKLTAMVADLLLQQEEDEHIELDGENENEGDDEEATSDFANYFT